jgi:hypothetical protein
MHPPPREVLHAAGPLVRPSTAWVYFLFCCHYHRLTPFRSLLGRGGKGGGDRGPFQQDVFKYSPLELSHT